MQNLFPEFKPNTANDWKNQVIKDLKGESFESLIWHNENGIDIQPFYTSEDLKQSYTPAFNHISWEICVKSKSQDSKRINTEFLKQLNSGTTAIALNCAHVDFEIALKNVQLNFIHSTFRLDGKKAAELKTYLDKHYKSQELSCSLIPERLENKIDLDDWKKVMALFSSHKQVKTISVNVLNYHNLNCFAYYELALIVSQLTEYFESFANAKDIPSSPLVVRTGVNSDYFVQMAKLRAIRRLWEVLKAEYQIQNEIYVIVETSLTNKSISDSYTNLLRTTVEAMSAVAGGCNELVVNEFDILFPTNKSLGERMAINQQLILKEESYLDKMADIACGSYYVESLTDALAEKALETFKRFETEGGYFECIHKNIFEKEIQIQASQKNDFVNSKKQIFIGVNKFKNESEKIELSKTEREELKHLKINNPSLNFELEHFFTLNHA